MDAPDPTSVDPADASTAIPPDGPGTADSTDLVTVLASQPEPGRSFGSAARERPALVLLPAVLGLALGLAAGFLRPPQYTAEARLAVARIDVATQSLPGFAAAVQDLAVTYARLATATEVTGETARLLSVDPADVEHSISASPIHGSPLFRIEATADTAGDAVANANAAGQALRTYVARLNSENPDTERLYGMYLLASRDRIETSQAVRAARAAFGRDPNPVLARRLSDAQARAAGAALKARSVQTLYRQSLAGTASANVIQLVNPAQEATSDRGPSMRRLGFTGLVLGLLVGAGLVMFLPTGTPRGYQPRHARGD